MRRKPVASSPLNGPGHRQKWITDIILEKGSILVDDLAAELKVSRMTIHRDLDELEHQGVLRKIKNGATAQPSSIFESDYRYRLKQAQHDKDAIAEVVLTYIETGQSIILDDSTTLLPLTRLLPKVAPLTVITNFLPIIHELTKFPEINLICLGGEYDARFDTFTGMLCEQAVSELRASVLITSTSAVSDGQAYHPDPQIIKVKQAMMKVVDRKMMLLDHTKFNKTALHHLADLKEFDHVIIDHKVDKYIIDQLEEKGIKVDVS